MVVRHDKPEKKPPIPTLAKTPSGIQGRDEVTLGGLPKGRPTLVCGGAGCGKTLFAAEFLVRGATKYNEPGVFLTFEETEAELTQNVRSLGFDLSELVERRLLSLDFVRIERSEIEETGTYDLEGLFVRLGHIFAHCSPDPTLFDSLQSAAPETFEVILQIDFAQGIFLHVSTKSIDDRWLPRQSVSLADLGASYNQVIGYALARGIIPASRLSQFEQFTGCLQPRQALPSMTLIFTTPAAGSLAAPSFFDQRLLGIDVPVIQVETNDEDEETYYTLQDIYESDGASGSRSFADAYFDTVSRWARANQ